MKKDVFFLNNKASYKNSPIDIALKYSQVFFCFCEQCIYILNYNNGRIKFLRVQYATNPRAGPSAIRSRQMRHAGRGTFNGACFRGS
jgi:hypothetical protein